MFVKPDPDGLKVISLEEVPQFAEKLLAGKINGRVVVDLRL